MSAATEAVARRGIRIDSQSRTVRLTEAQRLAAQATVRAALRDTQEAQQ